MEHRLPYKKILHYFSKQIRPYRISFFSAFIAYGAAAWFASGLIPLIYRHIIDILSSAEIRSVVVYDIWSALLALIGAFLVMNVFFRIGDFCLVYSQSKIMRALANDAFMRVSQHSYQFFTNTFTGSLVAKARRYVNSFETIHDQLIFAFWLTGANILVIIATLLWLSPLLGIVMAVWVVLFVAFTIAFFQAQRWRNEAEAAMDSKVTGRFADVFTNILTIKMFSSRGREIASYEEITNEQERIRRRAWNFQNIVFLFQALFTTVLEVGGMYLVLYLWVQGEVSTGTVVLVQLYFGTIFKELWNLGKSMNRFNHALSDAAEMVEIFETPVVLADPVNPKSSVHPTRGEVVFSKATFQYGEGNEAIFHDFNLTIAPGERVGVVGPSGAGKSTITKLILRFVDIQEGTITIDGVDVREMKQDDLRQLIAYVPQDPILFHRSLEENIAYGKSDATKEEIVSAAKKAHAHEFIEKLPSGYATLVGERGIKLSGGERQRIAIARAILKNAPILILDEATSSLDSMSEMYIQAALEELMKGRTTLVIAHRLSTIQKMDRIIVLDAGRVVEEGSHKELLDRKGLYHTLWTHQSSGFIE